MAVRCRPALEHETQGNNTFEFLHMDEQNKCVSIHNARLGGKKAYGFDIVMDQKISQKKVFEVSGVQNLVKHVIDVSVSQINLLF